MRFTVDPRLLGAVLVGLALAPARAQPTGRPGTAATLEVIAFDPCPVAPLNQFRFLLAAGIGHSVPVTRTVDGNRLVISSLAVTGLSCSPMRAALRADVKRVAANGQGSDSTNAVVPFLAGLLATASFRTDSAMAARTASALASASLCVSDIELTRTDPRPAVAIDPAKARAWLADTLHERCFDITSLVYVYLQRGGTLVRQR